MTPAVTVRRALRKSLDERDIFLLKEFVFRRSNPLVGKHIAQLAGISLPEDMRVKGILFIHIPRTGGTSIAIGLYGHKTDHHSAAYYKAVNDVAFGSCFKFAFVRNPWDRLVSAYHLLRTGRTEYVRVWTPQKYAELLETDFNYFVKNWLWKRKRQIMGLDTTLWPQSYFTHAPNGKPLLDYIGRCENLEHHISWLNQTWSISIPSMHLNRSENRESRNYRSYYGDPDTIEAVREIYAQDIEIFQYDF
jgi:hypothetical protein